MSLDLLCNTKKPTAWKEYMAPEIRLSRSLGRFLPIPCSEVVFDFCG